MPTLTIRQIEDDVYQALKAQAKASGRSMEAEVREILASAVRGRSWWRKWLEATEKLRGDDLPIPPPTVLDELIKRVEAVYENVPPEQGMAEIDALVASERSLDKRSAV